MIVLRNEQLDVFRASARKKLGESIRLGLLAQGLNVEQRASDLILRDSRKQETRLTFAASGLPESIVRPSQLAYRFEFDKAGRLATIVYPSGRQLAFSFDAVGNVTELSQPGFARYQLSYVEPAQEGSPLESVTYPDGRIREISYDGAGRVTAVTEPSGACYEYDRDEQGRISAIIDPLLREIELISDNDGALQGVEFPDGSLEGYLFDEEEKTAVRVHRDGSETHYQFDDEGRLAQLTSGIDGSTRFGYDNDDNLVFAERGDQRISFTLDHENITEELSSDGKVLYDYDGGGQLVGLQNHFGDVLRYGHDLDGRLSSIRIWDGRVVQISSNEEDLVSEIQFPGGVGIIQYHGSALRLLKRQVLIADRLLQEDRYNYDECSRYTGSEESASPGRAYRVSYDLDDHVVREDVNGLSQDYRYDAKGNMVGIGDREIVVGPMDEPVHFGEDRIEYDGRGNMLRFPDAQGVLDCKYRHDGMLVECRIGSEVVTFGYDALGRRIEKRTKDRIWRYGWNGHQLLWEDYRQSEYATPVRRDYLFLPGSMLPLGFRELGRCFWLMTDARGAVDLAVDEQGQVVWKASYDSFGRTDIEINEVRQPWRLQGQYADDETGLYYNFARYYSPYLRSYLSLDPRWIEFDASHYSLCRNDPWNRADPFGGLAPLLVIGIAGVVGGLVGGITAVVTGGDPLAGAVEGAVAGAGAVVAVVAGASAAVVIAAGVVATGVGAFAGQMTEQARKGDKVSIRCALMGAALAAATDLALLGLGKIPFVKQLAKAAGKKLAKLFKPLKKFTKGKIDKAAGLVKKLKGRLKNNTVETRRARKMADRSVRESQKASKIAKRTYPNGIKNLHADAFKKAAKDNDSIYIVRAGNPDSIKYQGKSGYTAKPVTCKAKTAKFGPDAGLVVDPTHKTQAAYWDAAERAAGGNQKKLAEVKEARKKAVESWGEFAEKLKSDGSGYSVNEQGQVLNRGKKIHGDYDLHGVYDAKKDRVDFGSGKAGDLDEIQAKRRKALNDELGSDQIQHGGQDDWVPKKGKTVNADPPVTAYMPDGREVTMKNVDEMKSFYESNGIPWPYPKTGK